RVAGARLLSGPERGNAGGARRAADPGSRQRAHAAARRAATPARAVRGAGPDGHGPPCLLARARHREHPRRLLLLLALDAEGRARDLMANEPGQLLVQMVRLPAELVQRILLGVAAKA